MKTCRIVIATLVTWMTLWCAPALAQPAVFFDDFDGNALAPHWSIPDPSVWEYNVSNSMLNVTGLLSPSHPKSPTNFAAMGAPFAPQADFQLDARMGWGSSEGVARFELIVRANSALIAHIGYREHDVGGQPGIFAGTNAGVVAIPSPLPGIYDFRITRIGGLFNFYFDGNHFASLTSSYTGPVNGLSFFFSSPYPGPSGPFHIDNVRVVPQPGVLMAILMSIIISSARRKRA